MITICSGMPRSGSTWSYNVTRLLLQRGNPSITTGFLGPLRLERLLSRVDGLTLDYVIKIHDVGPTAHEFIRERRIHNVHTWRDPRDAVASAHRLWGTPVEEMLLPGRLERYAALLEQLLADGHTLFVPYGTIRTAPASGVARIAKYLGLELDDAAYRDVADATSFERHKEISSDPSMPLGDAVAYNPITLLHRGHIQDGRTGYWKEVLTPAQVDAIMRSLGDTLAKLQALAAGRG